MASRQTIARLPERIESLAEALSRADRKTHYILVGATEAGPRDACAERQIKELISSGSTTTGNVDVDPSISTSVTTRTTNSGFLPTWSR